MIRQVMTAGAALVVWATAAIAADLPSKANEPGFEPPPPIPVFSWSGAYLGFQAGYGFGRDQGAVRGPRADAGVFGYDPHGIIGGAHVGYNYALPSVIGGNALVIGAEGDVDGADYSRTASPFGGALAGTTVETTSEIKGSVRGRVGVGVNRVLFYATGGAAFAEFATRYNVAPSFGARGFDAFDRARTGYTVGGGVEYAFMNALSIRAEYRYTNYGTFVDSLGAAAPGVVVAHKETDNRVQAGLSYKLESILPPAVAARY